MFKNAFSVKNAENIKRLCI